ncbi:glutathione S-transferase N-terminal domain-containing protein [Colwellia sp. Bg11-28]|uniref:glutathione S-transferase N-terminal domain-containing protein n=1 Tax=Colwellia sp. Bg11-28 TaxID=2058305 RepID=UPI000C32CED2|nr:glutathione S-transferase N-terminal domain-containing protein [Colwellia sp. Bg11-28]PKH86846.1 lignin beta-etherase [Colwellia sp. Bg11-28]
MIKLYELAGKNNVIFSPYCWRVRLALLHKELDFLSVKTAFTDIQKISDSKFKTVPVIHDGNVNMNDSFKIIEYLEANYPEKPSLFSSNEGRVLSIFIEAWANSLHSDIARMAIADIHSHLQDQDKPYFRRTRESFFGKKLEDVQQENYDTAKESFLSKLSVLEKYLTKTEFIGGASPLYPDFIVFGSLQWLFTTSHTFEINELSSNCKNWFLKISQIYVIQG